MLDILLGIGIERRVDCERTPQCAGLGVHEGVVVKVCQDDGASVERELVVEVLEVDLLPAGDKRFRQARDGMEDEVELALDCWHGFTGGVGFRAGQGALAPDDARNALRVVRSVRVGDHAADVVADDMETRRDGEMLVHECDEDVGHCGLCEGVRMRRLAATAIVGSNDAVAGISQRSDGVAELVGAVGVWTLRSHVIMDSRVLRAIRLGNAVDKEDGAFTRCVLGRCAVDVMQAEILTGYKSHIPLFSSGWDVPSLGFVRMKGLEGKSVSRSGCLQKETTYHT